MNSINILYRNNYRCYNAGDRGSCFMFWAELTSPVVMAQQAGYTCYGYFSCLWASMIWSSPNVSALSKGVLERRQIHPRTGFGAKLQDSCVPPMDLISCDTPMNIPPCHNYLMKPLTPYFPYWCRNLPLVVWMSKLLCIETALDESCLWFWPSDGFDFNIVVKLKKGHADAHFKMHSVFISQLKPRSFRCLDCGMSKGSLCASGPCTYLSRPLSGSRIVMLLPSKISIVGHQVSTTGYRSDTLNLIFSNALEQLQDSAVLRHSARALVRHVMVSPGLQADVFLSLLVSVAWLHLSICLDIKEDWLDKIGGV